MRLCSPATNEFEQQGHCNEFALLLDHTNARNSFYSRVEDCLTMFPSIFDENNEKCFGCAPSEK